MVRSKNSELKEIKMCTSQGRSPDVGSVKFHGMKCSDSVPENIQLGSGCKFQNLMITSNKSELNGFVCTAVNVIFLRNTSKGWPSPAGGLKSFVSYVGWDHSCVKRSRTDWVNVCRKCGAGDHGVN